MTKKTYKQGLFSSKKRYKKASPTTKRVDLKLEILIAPKYKCEIVSVLNTASRKKK